MVHNAVSAGIGFAELRTQQIAADRITMQSNGDQVDSDAVQFQLFGMGTGSNQWETRQLMALGKLL